MITIPTVATELESREQTWSPERPWTPSKSPRILIVEDDPDVHEGWSVFLGHKGYEVLSAWDGCEGLAAIESEEPDLVLLDLGLPGMHGTKVLHEMRMRGLEAPIVVITALSPAQADLRVRSLGAEVVLGKPVSPYSLVPVIEDLLGGYRF